MQVAAERTDASTAIQTDLPAIFASLELSRSTWLITSLSPGAGEKMSKHSIRAGDVAGLLMRLAQLKEKARGRTGRDFPIIAIQEAGLDGASPQAARPLTQKWQQSHSSIPPLLEGLRKAGLPDG